MHESCKRLKVRKCFHAMLCDHLSFFPSFQLWPWWRVMLGSSAWLAIFGNNAWDRGNKNWILVSKQSKSSKAQQPLPGWFHVRIQKSRPFHCHPRFPVDIPMSLAMIPMIFQLLLIYGYDSNDSYDIHWFLWYLLIFSTVHIMVFQLFPTANNAISPGVLSAFCVSVT